MMIPIKLVHPENFLKVKETLTRMGIANQRDKVLYQSCHILKKQSPQTGADQMYIVHFKDMMRLDGKVVNISDEDVQRTVSIAKTLEAWGLIEVEYVPPEIEVTNNFRVIKAAQKAEWTLKSKYVVGA
ncbi:translational regulator protein [Acinetobacter phage vB_AbaM_Konradin]|uniref:Translation repressor protein n=9 Tax=Lazarusvirus TaxID=2842820 RepID=A0A4Y1NKL0_9CAUD|nr:translational repressor protein [Acinetobacter phage vB_ApiM_fHyAci03]YP_009885278.1 translational regulator protein [Acinetobacter phage vB_AbaM_Konradin]YP_009886124.1 translational regulator protein [Acinetobacter phage vB_AbaM_Berthold]YP_009886618.1 translational regulator protein [Acinetobacter phage vB_AbaM_Kimel]YP_009886868.1 translational regulator protein [Acinetobacter phage vB_AbaM_Lazarus]YP_009889724.1 translational regulator protein [Acinetobacter phage AM101]QGT54107.1 tra